MTNFHRVHVREEVIEKLKDTIVKEDVGSENGIIDDENKKLKELTLDELYELSEKLDREMRIHGIIPPVYSKEGITEEEQLRNRILEKRRLLREKELELENIKTVDTDRGRR